MEKRPARASQFSTNPHKSPNHSTKRKHASIQRPASAPPPAWHPNRHRPPLGSRKTPPPPQKYSFGSACAEDKPSHARTTAKRRAVPMRLSHVARRLSPPRFGTSAKRQASSSEPPEQTVRGAREGVSGCLRSGVWRGQDRLRENRRSWKSKIPASSPSARRIRRRGCSGGREVRLRECLRR